ncbi:LysE family translocator [Pinisolibacter aquiterrae]|uniref:LysE family translocator n=1 Tax=Pinisolibacter aquiterrae TaxID=2815579 RepID=UPI001C3D8502|nr:LysE family translocator [Pinisolibacter aquiterrae]MBV5264116.1 LysE family translocator [Pinisolibacter aquiterrae]MCC8233789.1 LysE family translocator [Pinisolibacter aquiterrae]
MEWLLLYLKSAGIGVAVAAPVGPMSLLCMRRTLTTGWRSGLATGAGIAIGDGIYAAVAALGLAGVSAFVLAWEKPLHLAAGLLLIWLGLKTFFTKDDGKVAEDRAGGSIRAAFLGSVALTLTNPPTIVMFAAVFTALAPTSGFDPASAVATVAGVVTGSLGWWIGVVIGVSGLRHALGHRVRLWIDRIAGVVLAVLGADQIRRA